MLQQQVAAGKHGKKGKNKRQRLLAAPILIALTPVLLLLLFCALLLGLQKWEYNLRATSLLPPPLLRSLKGRLPPLSISLSTAF